MKLKFLATIFTVLVFAGNGLEVFANTSAKSGNTCVASLIKLAFSDVKAENLFKPYDQLTQAQKLKPRQLAQKAIDIFRENRLHHSKDDLITQLAGNLHDEWRAPRRIAGTDRFEARVKILDGKEYDIANLSFSELPAQYQHENFESARVAINEIEQSLSLGKPLDAAFVEKASSKLHTEWVRRNRSWAEGHQLRPYSKLREVEKEKDRVIIRKGVTQADGSGYYVSWKTDYLIESYAKNAEHLNEVVRGGVLRIQQEVGYIYGPLAIDPGILSRLDDFIAFAKLRIKPNMMPDQLRTLFSDHLGHKYYYRGLRLSTAEFKDINETGIFANSLRNGRTFDADFDRLAGEGYHSILKEHGKNGESLKRSSPFMSVSDDEDMAHMVASRLGEGAGNVYVFSVRVPEIDTVRKDWTESFVLHWVNPKNIVRGKKVGDFIGPYVPPKMRSSY